MRSRLSITIIAILGLAITLSACFWQYGRGREKDRIAEQASRANAAEELDLGVHRTLTESELLFRRVKATGVLLGHTAVLMDNQAHGGQPGYVVFTAMRLDDGRHVLVKRGWIAGSLDRTVLPRIGTPEGHLTVEGVALPPSYRFLELADTALDGPVWQNVTVDRYRKRFGLDFLPVVLEQTSDSGDGLVRDWPRPASGSAKHYGYAFQWGGMATLIVILYVYFTFRKSSAARAS